MNLIEIEEQKKEGYSTFMRFFNMDNENIIKKVKSISGANLSDNFWNNISIIKSIVDDYPTSIKIYNFLDHSEVYISPSGIIFKPKYSAGQNLAKFNKHFIL